MKKEIAVFLIMVQAKYNLELEEAASLIYGNDFKDILEPIEITFYGIGMASLGMLENLHNSVI